MAPRFDIEKAPPVRGLVKTEVDSRQSVVVVVVVIITSVFGNRREDIVDEKAPAGNRWCCCSRDAEQERLNRDTKRMQCGLEVAVELFPALTGVTLPAVDKIPHLVVSRASLEDNLRVDGMPVGIREALRDSDRADEIAGVVEIERLHVETGAGISQSNEALAAALSAVSAHGNSQARLSRAGRRPK